MYVGLFWFLFVNILLIDVLFIKFIYVSKTKKNDLLKQIGGLNDLFTDRTNGE